MTIGKPLSEDNKLNPRESLTSLAELILGVLVVICHNIYHLIPNEVPILFGLFWVSGFLRGRRWRRDGFTSPQSWRKILLYAFAAAALLQLGSEFLVAPLAHYLFPEPERVSSVLQGGNHDWRFLFKTLAIVWIFAAFGEEIGYRGYLVTRAADLGGSSKLADVLVVFAIAIVFGFGHYYKGPAGIIDSTYSGIILGSVYLLSGRNLWAAILAHGVSDTVAVTLVFLGYGN